VHLVGFIIRIYHDARSPERQKKKLNLVAINPQHDYRKMHIHRTDFFIRREILNLFSKCYASVNDHMLNN